MTNSPSSSYRDFRSLRLRGKLITLRRPRRSDASVIRSIANNRSVSKYLPEMPHPYSEGNARAMINESHHYGRTGSAYTFCIVENSNSDLMGCVGLRNVNSNDRNAEMWYWLGRKYWHKGYASDAVRLTLQFAFESLHLMKVYAVVQESNVASVNLLERHGFTREAHWRKGSFMNGRWYDVYGYGILRNEF